LNRRKYKTNTGRWKIEVELIHLFLVSFYKYGTRKQYGAREQTDILLFSDLFPLPNIGHRCSKY